MLRELGIFERAVMVSNQHAPFHINIVVELQNPPVPEKIKESIRKLQSRHPFLRARIMQMDNQYCFIDNGDHQFPFQVIKRENDKQWIEVTEKAMATGFNIPDESLFRVYYLFSHDTAELILSMHHAISDAVSATNLVDELLTIATNGDHKAENLQVIPKLEDRLPKEFKRSRKFIKLVQFGMNQFIEELIYQAQNLFKRKPPVRLGGQGRIITRSLSEEFVNSLAYYGRKQNLTLNSILNSAQLLAVNRHLYQGKPTRMYTFTFADLRPFTTPPTAITDLGSFISMLRFPVKVNGSSGLWEIAKQLQNKIQKSLKSGGKFTGYLSSEMMLKMITKFKIMRFGANALNYNAVLNLKSKYGNTELTSFHGFISGYDLGPELGSQVGIFNGRLFWDFTFLETDYSLEKANQMVDEIILILKDALSEKQPSPQ
jgi:NRPS condensation-like uncharacterized protein